MVLCELTSSLRDFAPVLKVKLYVFEVVIQRQTQ